MEKYPFISMRFFTDYSFTDYEVKDKVNGGSATLVTKSHVKLDAKLVQHYSPKFKSYLGIGFQAVEYENTLTRPLVNPNLSLWDFNGGLIYNPWSRLSLDLSLHYGDNYYVRNYNATHLKFSKHLVPSVQLQANYDMFSFGDLDFGLGGKIGYTMPFTAKDREEVEGNFDVEGSLNYGADLYARKQFEKWSIGGGVGVMKRQLNTSITEGDLTEVTIGLKIAIPFGWNEGK